MGSSLWLVVKGKMLGIESHHTSIGDEAFALQNGGVSENNIVAEKDSFVGSITIEKFEEIIGGPLKNVVEVNGVM